MFSGKGWMILAVVIAAAVGCSQGTTPSGNGQGPPAVQAEGRKYLLASEPAGARGVLETRQQAKDGDEIVLVGRIAGSKAPFVEGRASFTVADLKIEPCPDAEGCPTPWDCCCTPSEQLLPALAQVKLVGADGKTLPVGAKELLGIKELTVVVVKGKANRDEKGNLTVVASGLFARKGKE